MRLTIWFLLVFVVLGCARFFSPQRSDTVRYEICLSGEDCGKLILSGDSVQMRVAGYSNLGVKIFDVYVYSDSVRIVYLYDESFRNYLNAFNYSQNARILHRFLTGLKYGFPGDFFKQGEISLSGNNYCIGFLCFTVYFESFDRRQDRIILREGRVVYGINYISFRRV